MNPKELFYKKSGIKVCENLKKHFFDAYYVDTKEDALKKSLELISKQDSVSWGGTITMEQIGLKQALIDNNYILIDRDTAKSPEERVELMHKALSCGTYIMSANAITSDGQLFNIDGNGNRVAALCYGPKNILVIAGMNKVVKTVEDAYNRARNFAAPANKQRFEIIQTPCETTGQCANCVREDSICNQFVLTRLSHPKNRIKVILVGEDLGL